MKSCIVLCVLSVAVMALARPKEAQYTDCYDDVDLNEILGSRRLLVLCIKCTLDQGKCAPDTKEQGAHQRSPPKRIRQMHRSLEKGSRRVIGHLMNHKADYWNELTSKYVPERKFTAKYEKELVA